MYKKNRKKSSINRKLAIITLLFLACSGLVYWFQLRKKGNDLSNLDPSNTSTLGPNTKGNLEDQRDKDSKTEHDNKPSNDNIELPADVSQPTGNFVSSHTVKKDSVIASNCVTTSGARCTISFTKDGITKELPYQVTDLEGATYWEWTPEQIRLTTGEWQIEAKATNGTKTVSALDALKLRVN